MHLVAGEDVGGVGDATRFNDLDTNFPTSFVRLIEITVSTS